MAQWLWRMRMENGSDVMFASLRNFPSAVSAAAGLLIRFDGCYLRSPIPAVTPSELQCRLSKQSLARTDARRKTDGRTMNSGNCAAHQKPGAGIAANRRNRLRKFAWGIDHPGPVAG